MKLRTRPNGAYVLTGKTKLREAIAIITQLNLFIGPDSGLLQAAASQGIPSVGLYGPFDAKVRTAYFDKPTFVKLFKDAVRRQGSRRGRPRPKKLRNLTELVQHEFLACLNVARVYGWEKGLLFNDPEYLRLRRWHPDKASVGDGGNGSENGDVAQMALDTLVAGLESGELSVVQAS